MTKYQFKNVTSIRSKTMSAIRGKDTSIELLLRRALFSQGLRYRIHYANIPGSPDIAFVKKRIAIFCDSEFWHGKDWLIKKKKIKNNRMYWIHKIEENIERDKNNMKSLEAMGWTVLRFWETEIKKDLPEVLANIVCHLQAQGYKRPTRSK
jgi:DNA mismatch endonuclease, patch repair protein